MIIESSYTVGHDQIDARKYVTETHVFDTADVVSLEYLASPKMEPESIMQQRVPILEEEKEKEQINLKYRQDLESGQDKVYEYLKEVDLKIEAGLTEDELAAVGSVIKK